ncbi:MAG: small conductance mechanosensitive channel [Patiriisocius sp.]|jgi:small conductance mechanosensitive channel
MFEPFLPRVVAAAVFAGILTLFFLAFTSLIIPVVLAPLEESTRNQILGLIGLLMSAIVALSSTAFVTNFMAAIMLRVTRPFKVGDFITVCDPHSDEIQKAG